MSTHINTYEGHFVPKLEPNQILVFNSNTEGQHNKGLALLAAKNYGAIYGRPKGIQGQSFAICTRAFKGIVHPTIEDIVLQIVCLYTIADIDFLTKQYIVPFNMSTNFGEYTVFEIAIAFSKAGPIPSNILFNKEFAQLIDTSLWANKSD